MELGILLVAFVCIEESRICTYVDRSGAELVEKGEFEKAKEALEAAIMVNSKFDGAYTHLALLYQKMNRPEKSQQVLEVLPTQMSTPGTGKWHLRWGCSITIRVISRKQENV
jgi:tetratricopeptide (TPR) repeat protein